MNVKSIYRPVFYICIASLFLLFFSVDTSLITGDYYGSDSAMFMLFGKMMNQGYIAYKDMFDLKGPYLFLLQQIGQLICVGKTGAFIIQLINLLIIIYLIIKIIEFSNKNISFIKEALIVIACLWFFAGTISGGNLSEEFSLPLLLWPLLNFIKYLSGGLNIHRPLYSLLYGIIFGVMALSRITNAAFLCSIVLVVYVKLLINKEYKNLLANIFMFLMGAVLAFIPMLIFYYINGALKEMLYDTFVYGFLYSGKLSLSERIANYFTLEKIIFLLPVFFPLVVQILQKNKKDYFLLFSIISTAASIIATMLGKSYLHYFILIIPNIVFGFYLLVNSENKITNKKILTILIIIVVLLQSYYVAKDAGKSIVKITDYSISEKTDNYYKKKADLARDIASNIPNDEKKDVWGYGIKSSFYLITDTYPCIKHFDYLEQHLTIGNVKEELASDLNETMPKWIIVSKESEDIPDFISNFINENYNINDENSAYYLYKLR